MVRFQDAPRAQTVEPHAGAAHFVGRLRQVFGAAWRPAFAWKTGLFIAIAVGGILLRLRYSGFLETFEDPYQNWWISANTLQTGRYLDPFSMMTHGNWLPLYHFFGAGLLAIAGLRNFEALKLGNIAISTVTATLVFAVGRRRSSFAGFAALAFFSFNLIDIAVSGEATAEELAAFLVFLSYAFTFVLQDSVRWSLAIAATALLFATMTRYEAWLAVILLVAYALVSQPKAPSRKALLLVASPAILFMIAYFTYALQWGFLPELVVRQTSTDIQYQLSVGTQRSPIQILYLWWAAYVSFFPLVFAIGGLYAAWTSRREFASWIIISLWGFTVVYTVLQFGNPSFRYVLLTVPFLSLMAASGLEGLVRHFVGAGNPKVAVKQRATWYVAAVGAIVIVGTMLPAPAAYWQSGFPSSRYMEPLVNAGLFLSNRPLPAGKILLTESPISAYYSGYPPDRMLGSRYLAASRSAALAFIEQNVAYVVYVGVPYYTLRTLFPELQNGTSTPNFLLLYDAGGPQVGWHAVYVYAVVTNASAF